MNEFIDPPSMSRPNGFSHVVRSDGRRTVIVSGQVAYDGDGNVVGAGDLAAQVGQVYRNIGTALAACGAGFGDVVKTTLFVRDMTPEKIVVIRRARAPFLSADHPPASTMVGVQALARPELLLEVEAIAMID